MNNRTEQARNSLLCCYRVLSRQGHRGTMPPVTISIYTCLQFGNAVHGLFKAGCAHSERNAEIALPGFTKTITGR